MDRLIVKPGARARIAEALELALQHGNGTAIVSVSGIAADDMPTQGRGHGTRHVTQQSKIQSRRAGTKSKIAAAEDILLSSGYACTSCGVSFEPPHPQMFSFNSPQGMCAACDGLGTKFDFDPDLLVPDPSLSFLAPCIAPLRTPPGKWRRHIYEGVARHVGFDLESPWRDLPANARRALLYGTGADHITFEWKMRTGVWKHGGTFEGVIAELHGKHKKSSSAMVRRFYEQFMRQTVCPVCHGARLTSQALAITLNGPAEREAGERGNGKSKAELRPTAALNINEICMLPISAALRFFDGVKLDGVRRIIAEEPLKEIRSRLRFLVDVGLDYLALDRPAPSLSGGESQRIRLASQIGCGLVGVLYVLDEPSIGLHPRDNQRLLQSLRKLRDMGNTVIVVEHDRDTMEAADEIVDFGPGPGVRGGRVVAQGTVEQIARASESITGAYLSGRSRIEVPAQRRPISRPRTPAPRKARGNGRNSSD